MTFYLLLPLLAFAFNLGLASFTLRGQPEAQGRRIFALFLLGMSLWGGLLFLMRSSPTLERAFFWDKLVIADFALIAALYLHFTYPFSGLTPMRWLLPTTYGLKLAVIVLTLLDYTITGMQQKPYGYAPLLGTGFYLFLAFIYTAIILGLLNVVHTYRKHPSPALRNRAAYLLAGTIFSLIGGTTDYLPVLGVPIYPLGIVGNILFALLATIAIVKGHLVDIRQTLRMSLIQVLVAGVVVAAYAVFALSMTRLFEVSFSTRSLTLTFAFLILVAAGLPTLMTRAQRWVERGFYRQQYWPLKALERFSYEMKDSTNLESLTNSLVTPVRAATQAEFVSLLLPKTDREVFLSSATVGTEERFQLPHDHGDTVLGRLGREDRVFLAHEVSLFPEWPAIAPRERARLVDAGVRLYVPLKSRGELTGLLILGRKAGGKAYTQEDIDLLQTVSYQAATGMENARLYQELREQLQELKDTQAQLMQSAKLASVGTLAAGVAHEISNPIFSIMGRAELLLDDPKRHLKTDKANDYISVIYEMSQRVDTVVRDLLTFSRQDESFAPVDLNSIAEQTLHLVEHELRTAGLETRREYAEDLPLVLGSRNKIQQTLLNLVLNAKDAMAGGGRLTLRTQLVDGNVHLSCIDTGEGIPTDRLERIFDAFYTTKDVGKGVGLGLYICQRLIHEHNGGISVQSTLGKGSSFVISLPVPSSEALHETEMSSYRPGTEMLDEPAITSSNPDSRR